MSIQGMSIQGMSIQGMSIQGMSIQGMSIQGMSIQGMSIQGMSIQGMSIQGSQLRGIDRERGLAGPMEFRGLSYVGRTSPGTVLQGVQGASAVAIDGTQPGTPPQLQQSPSGTGAGSYIKANVPGMSGAENELQGTFWNMSIADSTGQGAIALYVADVAKDVTSNASKYSANDDIYLYTVYYRHPATAQWISMCPYDEKTGKASAMAMPLNSGDWSSTASRQKFGFTCTASGVGSKCARIWGYKPWKTVNETVWTSSGFAAKAIPLQPLYDACLISARADYCQDGQSYTKNGTLVDLFDTLDGLTSINPTAGTPYAPNALGPMMHEEYQISALDLMGLPSAIKPQYAVSPSDPVLMSMSPEDRAALLGLRRSGLQSSRYADLDPGRTCLASGYIDRCDPTETYGCYRDDNMSANPYGAMIAVNSPRHCDHNEVNDGAPLDPLCNACVTRVCSVDPTCCGDAGNTFFPGSLVWDQRCNAIRQKVCKSGASDTVWRAADVAPVAGGKPTVYLRGATGALDGVVVQAGIPYLEGWACDPDFPGASSTIQVSVGGLLGAAGTRLVTARADLGIADLGARADVAAECGTGRHAFRVPLLATDLGKTVYAYGVDLNTPGAPFSILRGGQKTIPGAALAAPRAAIWTGWVEAAASGQHTFSVTSGPNDAYRVWVNGQYVAAARWPEPDPTSPAGFFVAPPIAPTMFLQKSVRYGVRIEYLRSSTSDSSSTFALRWLPPSGAVADVPTSALHSTNPGTGNGLLGSYFKNNFALPVIAQTYGPVDYVWTTGKLPGNALPLTSPFSARFEGQVVPPVSGTYTFTADSDGAVSIWVNGKAVTTANQKPAGTPDPTTCDHDICRTGGAIDRACSQGYFCAAQICTTDPYCCATTWDPACLQKVSKVCNIDCRQTTPSEVTLLAGVKYDIKVELQHDATPFGAKLRLYWALDGGARDTIPVQRLFATPTPAPAVSGYGLNGAYFSDVFQTQVLDHADLKASFATSALPRVDRLASSVCAYSGGPACSSDVIGAPGLTTPVQGQAILAQSMVFKGVGAVSNATVTVTVKNRETGAAAGTATGPATTLGAFTTTALVLPKGKYTATASQPGSAASAPVDFDFTLGDPTLPVSPVVTVPTGGIVATTGNTTIGGTATPGAKVTVTVTSKTVPPTTTTYTNISTNATTGAWTLAIALPSPGGYTVSSTQLANGSTSPASAPVDAEYAIPAVVVTTPAENASFTTGTITVTGTAKPGLGKIIVADGDERYFVERQTIDVGSDGKFPPTGVTPVPLALDTGRHVLKIFQRLTNSNGTTNLDGEPVLRHIVMTPAAGANLTIDCAALGTSIGNDVALIKGSGAPSRTGLRYSVNIYQGATKVATAKVEDNGTFSVSNVHLTGVGPQTLKVTLVASSLSGGGVAESLPSTKVCTPSIKPAPPVIKSPVSATPQPTSFPVSGTGIDTAKVTIYVDGVAKVSNLTVSGTTWATTSNLTVTNGSHRIQATQTLGVPSDPSTSVIVMVGDVLPPSVTVTKPALLTQFATDPKGLAFDFVTVAGVVATDNSVSLPVTCVPATNTLFALGTTYVTCSAKDATGNVGSTSFKVIIKSKAGPVVTGSTVAVEATGPYGAAVSYQVGATGFVANCGPNSTIVACARWELATSGLAFTPTNVAVDPRNGALYASQQVDPMNTTAVTTRMVTWSPLTNAWTELPFSGPELRYQKISVAPTGSKSTIYIPTISGLYAHVAGDQTSKVVLPGVRVRGTSVDPNDPTHVFAWNDVPDGGGPAVLFETTDSGLSWTLASDGLPTENVPSDSWANYPHITDVAFDRLHPGRIYATMEPLYYRDDTTPDRIFRRVGKTAWERLALPPLPSGPRSRGEEVGLGVAPNAPAGQAYPTVFVGSFISTDGGETWSSPLRPYDAFTSLAFDSQIPGTVYALLSWPSVSTDFGKTWQALTVPSHEYRAILQDPIQRVAGQAKTLYLSSRLMSGIAGGGVMTAHSTGLYKGINGGASWAAVDGAQLSGQLRGVQDMAFDPFNFRTAYLFARSGVFKTTNMGDAWTFRSTGIQPVNGDVVVKRNKIAIDPFNRQFLYLSGAVQPGPDYMINVLFSPDGAGDQGVGWGPKPVQALFAADPGMKDVYFSSPRFYGEQAVGLRGLVYLNTPSGSQDYELDMDPLALPHGLEVLPDAARTVVVSYHWFDPADSSLINGGIALFSAKNAQLSPSVTPVRLAATGRPSRGPVFDNSDGKNSLFLSGDARGASPDLLYKASVENLSWAPIGGGQPGIDFRRLVIDRGSGGQLMYTVGSDDSFWESQDGGKTWAEDQSAPSFIYKAWSSIDGTLYAAVSDTQTTTEDLEDLAVSGGPVRTAAVWRRGLDTSLPPGARIMQGPLHVSCLGTDQGRSVAPGSVFPMGSPTVLTCTATDVFGNTGTGTVSIAVSDTLPPNIIVTPPTGTTTSTDPNVLVPVTISARATDAVDGDVAMTCTAPGITGSFTPAQGASFKLGVTIVTCTAKDQLNHVATASFPVTVTKSGTSITAPTLTVPGPTTIEATGPTGGTSTFAVSAKKSTGTTLTPTCTPALSSTFLLNKTTTVSCSITDSGYTVTKTFDVSCVDRTPPAITATAPAPVSAQGAWGATVTYTATKTDKVDGGPTATPCSPASGSIFAIGTTPVVCSAVDKAGNSTTKSFNVVVSDLSAPKVTVPAVIEVEPQDNLGARVTYTGVSATDAQDGTRPVDCAPLSGSWFPLGESRVSCQATDLAGNTGRATFIVRVIDKTAPTVTVPRTIVVEASSAAGGKATFVPSAFDTVGGTLPTTCTRRIGAGLPTPVVSSSTVLPMGDTVVTCSATDAAGNVGSASFLVIVRDTSGPVLTLPPTTYGSADAAGTAVVTFSAKATDFGVDVPVVCTPPSGTRFLFGTTPVTCVAHDSRGNATSGTFNVVVRDTTLPVITNVPATKVAYATSTAGAVVTYTLPTATDAIDGVRPVTCTPASGSTFAINKTTVTCTASDLAGNKATATFTVWVQYQTGAFLAPLLPDGSALIQRSLGALPVAFALTGASAPITNLATARLTIAPVVGGVVGTFVNAIPSSGTGNLFTYDSVGKRYVFNLSLNLADGIFRLHAELGDGIVREVNFTTVMSFAPLTLAADWTGGSYSTALPASALADGVVYLRGAMSGTGSGRPFQMPVGQRPQAAVTLPIGLCSSVKGTLQIEADGWAYLFGDASAMSCFVSFEGLSYVVNNSANTALTLQTGWTNAGSPWRGATARISSDVVHLAGAITNDSGNTIAFTLPANMRPAAYVYVPINLCTPRKGRLYIAPSGDVAVYAETGSLLGCSVSLEGVTFPVANTAATGWTCLTPTNGWVAMPYSTRNTCVKNVDGVIRLSGSVQTDGTDMNALTLPVGLRPSKESYVLIDLCAGATGRLLVSPSGNVNVQYETTLDRAQCFASFEGAAFSL